MPEQTIITNNGKDSEQIKLVGLLHFLGNIFSGGFIGTILVIVYLMVVKDLTANAKQAIYDIINFNLSFMLYGFVSALLMIILIGFVLLPIILIIWFVALIIGFIKHLSGEGYKYPLTISFLK